MEKQTIKEGFWPSFFVADSIKILYNNVAGFLGIKIPSYCFCDKNNKEEI